MYTRRRLSSAFGRNQEARDRRHLSDGPCIDYAIGHRRVSWRIGRGGVCLLRLLRRFRRRRRRHFLLRSL